MYLTSFSHFGIFIHGFILPFSGNIIVLVLWINFGISRRFGILELD